MKKAKANLKAIVIKRERVPIIGAPLIKINQNFILITPSTIVLKNQNIHFHGVLKMNDERCFEQEKKWLKFYVLVTWIWDLSIVTMVLLLIVFFYSKLNPYLNIYFV